MSYLKRLSDFARDRWVLVAFLTASSILGLGWGGLAPDVVGGTLLLVSATAFVVSIALTHAWAAQRRWERIAGFVCTAACLALALWLPLKDLAGANVLDSQRAAGRGGNLQIPPSSDGPRAFKLVFDAMGHEPDTSLPYSATLVTPSGDTRTHRGRLQHVGRSVFESTANHLTSVWRLQVDLSDGARFHLEIRSAPDAPAVRVALWEGAQAPGPLIWLLIPLFIGGLILDLLHPGGPMLAALAAGSAAFGIWFDHAWAPDGMMPSLYVALVFGAVVTGGLSWMLLRVVWSARRRVLTVRGRLPLDSA